MTSDRGRCSGRLAATGGSQCGRKSCASAALTASGAANCAGCSRFFVERFFARFFAIVLHGWGARDGVVRARARQRSRAPG